MKINIELSAAESTSTLYDMYSQSRRCRYTDFSKFEIFHIRRFFLILYIIFYIFVTIRGPPPQVLVQHMPTGRWIRHIIIKGK